MNNCKCSDESGNSFVKGTFKFNKLSLDLVRFYTGTYITQ